MNLAIFEPLASGHHMIYFQTIAREALRRAWDVTLVTTKEASRHPSFEYAVKANPSIRVCYMPKAEIPSSSSSAALVHHQHREFSAWKVGYRTLMDKTGADFIYAINLDHVDKIIPVRGSPFGATPFSGMVMSVRFHHLAMGVHTPNVRYPSMYRELFFRFLSTPRFMALTVIDETLLAYVREERAGLAHKVHLIPDMASLIGSETREHARRVLGLRDDQVVLLVYGHLVMVKGVVEVLAAAAAPSCALEVVVLLAGTQDPELDQTLRDRDAALLRESGRLIEIPRFLTEGDEYRVFRASDIVWAGYRRTGMSGVMLQGASVGLPVIASETGLVGWFVRKHGIGEIVDLDNIAQISETITRLARNPDLRTAYGERGSCRAQLHTPALFGKAICDAIEKAANN